MNYALAKGIGFREDGHGYDFGSSGTRLVCARIDGKEDGTRIFNGSHVDSLKDELNYYPIRVGNFREYKDLTFDKSALLYDSSAYSIEVAGDISLSDSYR